MSHVRLTSIALGLAVVLPGMASASNADLAGRWRSAPEEISLTTEFDESVWGKNAKSVRTVEMSVRSTGEATLTVTRKVVDARGRTVGDTEYFIDQAATRSSLTGRPYLVHSGEPAGFEYHLIGGHFTGSMVRHVFEAIAFNAGLTLHVNVLAGRDPHHIAEAEFKAFARAFRQAKSLDPLVTGIPSTKGAL